MAPFAPNPQDHAIAGGVALAWCADSTQVVRTG